MGLNIENVVVWKMYGLLYRLTDSYECNEMSGFSRQDATTARQAGVPDIHHP